MHASMFSLPPRRLSILFTRFTPELRSISVQVERLIEQGVFKRDDDDDDHNRQALLYLP